MPKALLFAAFAACGNAVFVYGQRRAAVAANPFLFLLGAVLVCSTLFVGATLVFRTPGDPAYVTQNITSIVISGVGFFITFVGFYLLYSQFGAVYYIVYAIFSIITTSIGVGVLIYKEPFNSYQFGALILAVLAIVLFNYGRFVTR
jgi:drug/metabolite transporter (DMT)-like permease